MIESIGWPWGSSPSDVAAVPSSSARQATAPSGSRAGASFESALRDAMRSWRVSQHAGARMAERGISLSPGEWDAMEQAARQAESKGARDTYMVLGDVGFVVHLPSRTLVTALQHDEHPVVTQIDSVVFVHRPDR